MILNAILFNLCWFGLIFWGNAFIPVVALWLIWHIRQCDKPKDELQLIFQVTVIGLIIDSSLMHAGVFDFGQEQLIIPPWLVVLWAAFAATLNHSITLVCKSVTVSRCIGAFVVPMSYIAGERLNAVDFSYSYITTIATISIVWLLLLPYLISLTKRENVGYA
ncbi:DUF2878 domain-containing protein [Thalassotalea euphylliae]|uniref:DUF2878 domain-containing protein n=2 Tax=Thalassotalea euphylliae TaxID=1655234 RepID=A0A3E0TSH1_9GAMM|nr:DUF2878 domain-containing protein [Thalassotalea euphylliae]